MKNLKQKITGAIAGLGLVGAIGMANAQNIDPVPTEPCSNPTFNLENLIIKNGGRIGDYASIKFTLEGRGYEMSYGPNTALPSYVKISDLNTGAVLREVKGRAGEIYRQEFINALLCSTALNANAFLDSIKKPWAKISIVDYSNLNGRIDRVEATVEDGDITYTAINRNGLRVQRKGDKNPIVDIEGFFYDPLSNLIKEAGKIK